MASNLNNPDFYWQTARDSLLTPAALDMFQIALKHDGEDFDIAKHEIDTEYERATGGSPSQRHGGKFQTFIRVFEEAGWMRIEDIEAVKILQVTSVGRQAEQLLINVPDFLKAVPYFLTELLSRYQLNNPAYPDISHNRSIRDAISHSNVFPYWTIWKIMRECNNWISTEELRRFVFRIQSSEDIADTIAQILAFRQDKQANLSAADLNKRYPLPIQGANGEPKYIMGRAGMHIGRISSLIVKPANDVYQFNPAYLPLIDKVLANEPIFREYIDDDTWFRSYGQPVFLEEEDIPFSLSVKDVDAELNYQNVQDDDTVWIKVQRLLALNVRNILFVGPPGTSKTTYALSIGAKLADFQAHRFHNIQFHQSLGYEDFVIGYVPTESANQSSAFSLKKKLFLQACESARRDDQQRFHVLVIDELNRGDPSRIFGETLTYIERRNEAFELPYLGQRVMVPSNLVILATMNPFDKSIADLDQALDRRFEKIAMDPSEKLLMQIISDHNGMDQDLARRVLSLFKFLNSQLDMRIGQAYFKDARDMMSLYLIWVHRILPFIDKELRYDEEKRNGILNKLNDILPEIKQIQIGM